MMRQIKCCIRKDKTRIFLISMALAGLSLAMRRSPGVLQNLSDLLFVMGAVHIVAGGIRYIQNVGLFKTFSYMAYKKRWKHNGQADGELHPMSLAEYTVNVIMNETNQKPVGFSMCTGGFLCVASFLMALAGPWM